jgi:hypothetical protein
VRATTGLAVREIIGSVHVEMRMKIRKSSGMMASKANRTDYLWSAGIDMNEVMMYFGSDDKHAIILKRINHLKLASAKLMSLALSE